MSAVKALVCLALGAAGASAFSATAGRPPLHAVRASARVLSPAHTSMQAEPPSAAARRATAVAAGAALVLGGAQSALAARSGGRMGGSMSRGGGGRSGGGSGRSGGGGGGGGGGYRGGRGATNIIVSPGYGYSPFGFSPFGFSPFGFGGGMGFFAPPSWLLFGALGLIAFRTARDTLQDGGGAGLGGGGGKPGAALLLQVGVSCKSRSAATMFGKMEQLAASADTSTDVGLQLLVSDTCLALLRSSPDWVSARAVSQTAGFGKSRDTETDYRTLLVGERAKWEREARRGGAAAGASSVGGQTYMVITVMALLEGGSALPEVTSPADLRRALSQLAAEVSKDGNLVAADVLWTPQEAGDTLSREDMFSYFPELIDL
jgi:uncharacterized membrane protein